MKLVLEDWFGRIEISLEETFKWFGHSSFKLNIPLMLFIPTYHCLRADIKYNTQVCKKCITCVTAIIAFIGALLNYIPP